MTDVPGPEDFTRLLLGDEREYTREDVAAEVGVTVEEARTFWRALGFPNVGDAVAFTRRDVEALRDVLGLIDRGLITRKTALQLIRGMGSTISKLAEWHAETMSTAVEQMVASKLGQEGETASAAERPGVEDVDGRAAAAQREDAADVELVVGYQLAGELLPVFERILVHVWRRKITEATDRLTAVHEAGEFSVLQTTMTVGFADLVSFTRLSDVLPGRALAALVEVFEAMANDVIVANGGRMIKTMGDEVLFTADTPVSAASIACRLVEDIGRDPALPEIRVGLATGAVVLRLGDVFGTTTNLASRLTRLAEPNVTLVDEQTVKGLVDHREFVAHPLVPVEDAGLGQIVPYELMRPQVA